MIDAYIKLLRIDHWFKNTTIFLGLIFAIWSFGALSFSFLQTLIAFGLACLVSSACYVINQVADAKFDRLHPVKKNRILASGKISKVPAIILAIGLFLLSIKISAAFLPNNLTLTLLSLWLAGLIYNVPPLRLKDRPFLDVISESVNNPIRFLIGWFLVSSDKFPSNVILLATWTLGALFMTAKRYDEYRFFGKQLLPYRLTFKAYSLSILKIMLYIYAAFSIAVLLICNLGLFPLGIFLLWFVRQTIAGKIGGKSIETFVLSPRFIVVSLSVLIFTGWLISVL